jgi:hypothetical protein
MLRKIRHEFPDEILRNTYAFYVNILAYYKILVSMENFLTYLGG